MELLRRIFPHNHLQLFLLGSTSHQPMLDENNIRFLLVNVLLIRMRMTGARMRQGIDVSIGCLITNETNT